MMYELLDNEGDSNQHEEKYGHGPRRRRLQRLLLRHVRRHLHFGVVRDEIYMVDARRKQKIYIY